MNGTPSCLLLTKLSMGLAQTLVWSFPVPAICRPATLSHPHFVADREFNIGAIRPPPKSGLNSNPGDEWLQIKFDLTDGGTLQDVLNELNTGKLRIGLHIISFPDGSSESAILTPEPATIMFLGVGVYFLLGKKKQYRVFNRI